MLLARRHYDSLLMADSGESVNIDESGGDALVTAAYDKRTVSMWIKAQDGLTGWHNLYDEGNQDSGFAIRFRPDHYLGIDGSDDGLLMVKVIGVDDSQTPVLTTATNNYRIDADIRYDWLHVVVVYDATATEEVLVYVNNVVDNTSSGDTHEVPAEDGTDVRELDFGARINDDTFGPGTGVHWLGHLDDIRIYDAALSADDAEALYELSDVTTNLIGHWTMDGAHDRNIVYGYDNTVQTDKTTREGLTPGAGTLVEDVDYTYNLQGRLSQIDTDNDGDTTVDTTTKPGRPGILPGV